jgi:hypothetical protein
MSEYTNCPKCQKQTPEDVYGKVPQTEYDRLCNEDYMLKVYSFVVLKRDILHINISLQCERKGCGYHKKIEEKINVTKGAP